MFLFWTAIWTKGARGAPRQTRFQWLSGAQVCGLRQPLGLAWVRPDGWTVHGVTHVVTHSRWFKDRFGVFTGTHIRIELEMSRTQA